MENDKSTDLDQQVVIFLLGEGSYAVEIAAVREIIRPQPITEVPGAPDAICGVINIRSAVVPVLNLRRRCGLPPTELTRESRVVVVQVEDQSVGLQVDAVSEVMTFSPDIIEPAASIVRGDSEHLLRGVARLDDRLVMLLDLSRAINMDVNVPVLAA